MSHRNHIFMVNTSHMVASDNTPNTDHHQRFWDRQKTSSIRSIYITRARPCVLPSDRGELCYFGGNAGQHQGPAECSCCKYMSLLDVTER